MVRMCICMVFLYGYTLYQLTAMSSKFTYQPNLFDVELYKICMRSKYQSFGLLWKRPWRFPNIPYETKTIWFFQPLPTHNRWWNYSNNVILKRIQQCGIRNYIHDVAKQFTNFQAFFISFPIPTIWLPSTWLNIIEFNLKCHISFDFIIIIYWVWAVD